MELGAFVHRVEHNRKDAHNIRLYEVAEPLVTPEVQRTSSNLQVGTSNRFSQLTEKFLLHQGKFCSVQTLQYVLSII